MIYVAVAILIIGLMFFKEVKGYLFVQKRYLDGNMLRQILNEAADRAVRIIEEEGITKPDQDARKRIDASMNILNDVIREMGLDPTKFNTKGLIESKRHEILGPKRTIREHHP